MEGARLPEERLTHSVIGAFFEVYNKLGFGFLERVYAEALSLELRARGHHVEREHNIVVRYGDAPVGVQRLDMVVDGRLVVETKSTSVLHRESWRQLYSYLRASELRVGLLLHFGPEPKVHRVVHRGRTDA